MKVLILALGLIALMGCSTPPKTNNFYYYAAPPQGAEGVQPATDTSAAPVFHCQPWQLMNGKGLCVDVHN